MEDIKITFLIFDDLTILDAIGPYEVLSKMPGVKICFASLEPGQVICRGGVRLYADYSYRDISETDILLIPGGRGINNLLANTEILDWIRKIHETTKYTTSVCTGSLLLAAAGLLNNKKATTHWNSAVLLGNYGAEYVKSRYVIDGKIITAAGVSAGIDMSLMLVSILKNEGLAKIIQLAIEYDPNPPFDAGSPDKISKELLEIFHKANSERR